MAELDFHVREFASMLKTLPAHLPVSDALLRDPLQVRGVWYKTQQEHMVGWFTAQNTKGQGAYSRETPNRSSKTTYNRLQSAEGLIWIAEALGADHDIVAMVAKEVASLPHRSRSAFVRKHLPWEMIAELAEPKIKSTKARRSARIKPSRIH